MNCLVATLFPYIGEWAQANNVEIAYTSANSSWSNCIPRNRQAERQGTFRRANRQPPRDGAQAPRNYARSATITSITLLWAQVGSNHRPPLARRPRAVAGRRL
jgi:hypothetical protein